MHRIQAGDPDSDYFLLLLRANTPHPHVSDLIFYPSAELADGSAAAARRIFFGRLGELRAGYRDGMEDQLGALGLALNAVVYWNSLYINAAVEQLETQGWNLSGEIRARLSPLTFEHINFHGRYPIVRTHTDGQLRALRPLSAGREEE